MCAGEEFKGMRNILSRVPFFRAALCDGFRESDAARVEICETTAPAYDVDEREFITKSDELTNFYSSIVGEFSNKFSLEL